MVKSTLNTNVPTKAIKMLEWKQKYSFRQLVAEMINYDLELAREEKLW